MESLHLIMVQQSIKKSCIIPLVGGSSVGGLLKRFAPFSYLDHLFILSLNVKICIRFYCISSDFILFFYLLRVMLDERLVH